MLTIAQVERETGLSKDVLRVWERRYGFPVPERDESGDRIYSLGQVERLRLIKRLMDQGFRPGRLLAMLPDELESIGHQPMPESPIQDAPALALARMMANDTPGLRQVLAQMLARQGLHDFVRHTVPMLNEAVGDAWSSGRLNVFQEHQYTEEVSRVLRAAIGNLPPGNLAPRILLTTVSGEEHCLGLLMVEALLAPEGAQCISLGPQTPMDDLFRAVSAYGVQVLVLSFSIAFPPRHGLNILRLLREGLPEHVEIWAGGSMTRALLKQKLPGVLWTPELADCLTRLADWRERHRG